MVVQIPGQPVKATGDDLSEPLKQLVHDLNLESPPDARDGMAMIRSDALSLTKWVAGLLGTGGVVASALGSFVAWNVSDTHEALKVAIVAAAGLVVVAVVLMVGWVTTTDVRARAATQQARYQARARVTDDYLALVARADLPTRGAPTVEVNLDGR